MSPHRRLSEFKARLRSFVDNNTPGSTYNSKIKRQVNKAWQIRALYESSTPRPQVEV